MDRGRGRRALGGHDPGWTGSPLSILGTDHYTQAHPDPPPASPAHAVMLSPLHCGRCTGGTKRSYRWGPGRPLQVEESWKTRREQIPALHHPYRQWDTLTVPLLLHQRPERPVSLRPLPFLPWAASWQTRSCIAPAWSETARRTLVA